MGPLPKQTCCRCRWKLRRCPGRAASILSSVKAGIGEDSPTHDMTRTSNSRCELAICRPRSNITFLKLQHILHTVDESKHAVGTAAGMSVPKLRVDLAQTAELEELHQICRESRVLERYSCGFHSNRALNSATTEIQRVLESVSPGLRKKGQKEASSKPLPHCLKPASPPRQLQPGFSPEFLRHYCETQELRVSQLMKHGIFLILPWCRMADRRGLCKFGLPSTSCLSLLQDLEQVTYLEIQAGSTCSTVKLL